MQKRRRSRENPKSQNRFNIEQMDDWSSMFIFIILDKQGRKRKKKGYVKREEQNRVKQLDMVYKNK